MKALTGKATRRGFLWRARIVAAAVSGTVAAACAIMLAIAPSASAGPAAVKAPAASYQTISGAGSTWAENAINAWVSDVQQNGLTVNYAGVGSTSGRQDFAQGTVDFGASEIPYGVQDGSNYDPPPSRGYVYMPDVAGGTTFMYNLKIGTQRVTDLRLSGKTIADIFTGQIQYWDNAEIKADNPDLALPHIQIVPVVRSDGSGATADFTQWMLATEPSDWQHYCQLVGRNPCTQTSAYPVWAGDSAMVGQSGDTGVSGYVSQNQADGAIGYVEYSYAIEAGFPVAKVLNADGYYTEPTPGHVAVSLLDAQINMDKSSVTYLTENLSGVYTDKDPRTYELSAYSYLILPTDQTYPITANQGYSLGTFGSYALCQGQQQVDNLGYSALPINLVEAGYTQLAKIPGAQIPSASSTFIQGCNNPTFDPNGTNKLADTDPDPSACDKQGPVQCTNATGGAKGSGGAAGTQGSTTAGSTSGGSTSGGSTSGGSTSGGSTTGGTGTNGGTGATGSSSPGSGTTGGATVDTGPSCDPNTGVCSTAGTTDSTGTSGGTSAEAGNPVPVTLSASNDDGVQMMLMAIAAALFLGLCVIPPLAAQASDSRRQRRRAQWSGTAGDDDRTGGRS